MTLEATRLLRAEVALTRVYSVLYVPRGPLAGRHRARFTLVLTKGRSGWEIATLHNTLEAVSPSGPPRT